MIRVTPSIAIGEDAVAPPAGRQPTSCSRCCRPVEKDEGDTPLSHCYHCGFPLDEAATAFRMFDQRETEKAMFVWD